MYQPKIQDLQIRKLYLLKQSLVSIGISKPITEIVSDAIDEYLPKCIKQIERKNGTLLCSSELKEKLL